MARKNRKKKGKIILATDEPSSPAAPTTEPSGSMKQITECEKNKDTSKVPEATSPTPNLMGIPPELRNEIYRIALVQGTGVYVNIQTMQPGLLSVNRQIREEAMSIFHENEFAMSVYNLKIAPQVGHWCWKVKKIGIRLSGEQNWNNFKEWLRA